MLATMIKVTIPEQVLFQKLESNNLSLPNQTDLVPFSFVSIPYKFS